MDDPGQEHDIPNQRVIYATSPSSVTGCLQRHHDLPEILILRDVAADLTRTRFRTLDGPVSVRHSHSRPERCSVPG